MNKYQNICTLHQLHGAQPSLLYMLRARPSNKEKKNSCINLKQTRRNRSQMSFQPCPLDVGHQKEAAAASTAESGNAGCECPAWWSG